MNLMTLNTKRGTFLSRQNDLLGKILKRNLDYEPYFYIIAKNVLKRGDICVDCGANIGYHTVTLSNIVGETGKVYAIEPQNEIMNILEKNCAINNCNNVKLIKAAVGNSNKTVNLDPINYDATSIVSGCAKVGKGGEEVNMITLDSIFTSEIINFIKFDVQGCEVQAIEGAQILINRSRPIMHIEVENRWLRYFGANSKILLNKVMSLDYTLFKLESFEPKDYVAIPSESINLIDSIFTGLDFPIVKINP